MECTIFGSIMEPCLTYIGTMFGHSSLSVVLECYNAQERRILVLSYISIDHDGAMLGLVLHTSYLDVSRQYQLGLTKTSMGLIIFEICKGNVLTMLK